MAIDIFKHFVPVVCPVGHMGNFLLNFLSPITPENQSNTSLVIPYPPADNSEWGFEDAFNNLFGRMFRPYLYKHISNDPDYTPFVYEIASIAKCIIKVKYNMVLNNIPINDKNLELYYDQYRTSDNFPSDEFIIHNSSRWIKAHPGFRQQEIMPFQTRIFASFKPERRLIPYSLLLYKVSKRKDLDRNKFVELVNAGQLYKECMFQNKKPKHTFVDMYSLVIQQDLNDIFNLDAQINFTSQKLSQLDRAHISTMEILEKFNIDPFAEYSEEDIQREIPRIEQLILEGKV